MIHLLSLQRIINAVQPAAPQNKNLLNSIKASYIHKKQKFQFIIHNTLNPHTVVIRVAGYIYLFPPTLS